MNYYYNNCGNEGYNPTCCDPCNPCNPHGNCGNYPNYHNIVMKCKKKKKKRCSSISKSSSHNNSGTFDASYTNTKSCNTNHDEIKHVVKKKLKPVKKKLEPIWDSIKTNYILKCSRSMAFGYCNTIGGCSNLTVGTKNCVYGCNTLVSGSNNISNGIDNILLGDNINSGNHNYIFAFSDASGLSGSQITLDGSAYFGVTNGMSVYTNAARSVGVNIGPGGNSWNIICDVNQKRDMVEVDEQFILEGLSQCNYYKFKNVDQDEEDEQQFIAPITKEFN